MSTTTGKDRFNLFLNIYVEHIGELPNHPGFELRSQTEGKPIEVNMMFYTSFPSKYFQFINILSGKGKADARRHGNSAQLSAISQCWRDKNWSSGILRSQDCRSQNSERRELQRSKNNSLKSFHIKVT